MQAWRRIPAGEWIFCVLAPDSRIRHEPRLQPVEAEGNMMRINPHNPTMFGPISSGSELALRLAMIRQTERETGAEFPNTTEALIRQWEKSR